MCNGSNYANCMRIQCIRLFLTFPTGVLIEGNSFPWSVGSTATLSCSSDLDVVSIDWLHNGEVVAHSTSEPAQLLFNPVNDSIHDREYSCMVNTFYGVLEEHTDVTVNG